MPSNGILVNLSYMWTKQDGWQSKANTRPLTGLFTTWILDLKSETHVPDGFNGLAYYIEAMTETLCGSFPLSMRVYDTNSSTASGIPSVQQNPCRRDLSSLIHYRYNLQKTHLLSLFCHFLDWESLCPKNAWSPCRHRNNTTSSELNPAAFSTDQNC